MSRRRNRKKAIPEAEHLRPSTCTDCGRPTTGGGACSACVQRIRAGAEAEANPRPPELHPPEPEPPPEAKTVFLGAPKGCFRCGCEGQGMVCGGCSAELFGLPRREGDPVIKFPRNLSNCGY